MSGFRTGGTLVAAIALGALIACDSPATDCFKPSQQLATLWNLDAIDQQSLTNPGFPIPGQSDFLGSGYLEFHTRQCTGPNTSQGDVIATYLLNDAGGSPKFPSQRYAGAFTYDKRSGGLVLKAYGYTATGTVSGHLFTLNGDLSFLGSNKYTFVFVADTT